ncbi:hypothetical protein LMG33818_002620 [Halomonadaceae bacterium LMG 33818]|uniref:baseplate assembly protein n=1 Tax=Cernens ardua TaxID=3402176 RepID=UPI003EDBECE7
MSVIDLSQIAPPSVVESLDVETIFSDMLTSLKQYDSTLVDNLSDSDPAWKVLQVAAYRELVLRQRVNDAAKSVMLAYATGSDLDNLGALLNVERLMIDPGNTSAIPPVAPTYESDDDYRSRIQLSLNGLSVAGPAGAYRYHALSASGDVLDAKATSPSDGEVLVTVLSRQGDGTAPQGMLDTVNAAVSAEDTRPLTDHVTVKSAEIINYEITATLYLYQGPDASVVLSAAQTAAENYATARHMIGQDVTISGVYGALQQAGVQRVELSSLTDTLVIDDTQASYCTGITLNYGGIDE